MTLIDIAAAVGPVVGLVAVTLALFSLTALPLWAILAIALPVGGIIGLIGGIGIGMLIAFGIERMKQK